MMMMSNAAGNYCFECMTLYPHLSWLSSILNIVIADNVNGRE